MKELQKQVRIKAKKAEAQCAPYHNRKLFCSSVTGREKAKENANLLFYIEERW